MTLPPRGRFQGTLQILKFNWPFYAAAGAATMVGAALTPRLPRRLRTAATVGTGASLFWTLGSIAASWYVYDRSPLMRWEWLPALLPSPPGTWINLHAGLDESTPALQDLFPGSEGRAFDFYDPATMTEPSIRRARRLAQPAVTPTPVSVGALPLADGSVDAAFVLFAAHEVRSAQSRDAFFQELHRALRSGGRLILLEHLRDEANFAAFGPGFLHFLPRREWLRLASVSGFHVAAEIAMTPFTRVFVLERVGGVS